MKYKIDKPIRLSIGNLTQFNDEYIQYTISFAYADNRSAGGISYKQIYHGKSLVLNGKTEIKLDNVLNDYSFNVNYYFVEEEQIYIPTNKYGKLLNRLTPNENQGDIVSTMVKIELFDGDVMINQFLIDVTSITTDSATPYTATDYSFENYSKSSLVNHIPYKKTDRYFLGIAFGYVDGTVNIYDIDHTDRTPLTLESKGNYLYSFAIDDVIDVLEQGSFDVPIVIGRGTSDTIVFGTGVDDIMGGLNAAIGSESGTISRIMLNGEDVAVVDECYGRWYFEWWDINGWHSLPCSKVIERDSNENNTITNVYGTRLNLQNTVTNSYTLTTQRLTNEQVEDFKHIIEARYVMLYDSKNDENHWCIMSSPSIDVIKNSQHKTATIEITEISDRIH